MELGRGVARVAVRFTTIVPGKVVFRDEVRGWHVVTAKGRGRGSHSQAIRAEPPCVPVLLHAEP